jgi:hypothetical protein
LRSTIFVLLLAGLLFGPAQDALTQEQSENQVNRPALLEQVRTELLEPAPGDDEITRLMKLRYRAALTEFSARWNEFWFGGAYPGSSLDDIYATADRIIISELALCRSAQERLALRMRYVELAQTIARNSRESLEAGRESAQRYAQVRYRLWDALAKAIETSNAAADQDAGKAAALPAMVAEWLPEEERRAAVNSPPKGDPQAGSPRNTSGIRPIAWDANDDLPRQVAKARLNAAVDEMLTRLEIDEGLGPTSLPGMLEANDRLVAAEVAIADDPKRQAEARERHWKRLKSYETTVNDRTAVGFLTAMGAAHFRYLCLSSEIELLLARKKAGLPVDDLAAAVAPSAFDPLDPEEFAELGEVLNAALPRHPATIEPQDDALTRLLKARYNAAWDEARGHAVRMLAGLGGPQLADAVLRTLESQLGLASSAPDRVAIREKILALLKIIEANVDAEVQERRSPIAPFARAQFDRMNAEIQLLQARQTAQAKP